MHSNLLRDHTIFTATRFITRRLVSSDIIETGPKDTCVASDIVSIRVVFVAIMCRGNACVFIVTLVDINTHRASELLTYVFTSWINLKTDVTVTSE